jgi:hypothetical protein
VSDARGNDYFSFMSDKSDPQRRLRSVAQPTPMKPSKSAILGDTIDFVEESQIEVIESTASDTIIERLFNLRRRTG